MPSIADQRTMQRINALARARLIRDGHITTEDSAMNEVAMVERYAEPMTPAEIIGQVQRIQQVMAAVMKPGTHYGKIPGTDRPTLFKPGAEVLAVTFRIAPSYEIEDESSEDAIAYRVICTGRHQMSEIMLGQGVGYASSSEEKYKWRRAVSRAEFDNTLADRKRVKYTRDAQIQQVRAEPADIANTVLKMAAKRAQIAMTLNVLAASDMFAQDLEDMDDTTREQVGGGEGAPTVRQPAPKSPAPGGPTAAGVLTSGQIAILRAKMQQYKVEPEEIEKAFGVPLEKLSFGMFDEVQKFVTGESKPA